MIKSLLVTYRYPIHIWQVSPQLTCDDNCQKWMCRIQYLKFWKSEIPLMENLQSFSMSYSYSAMLPFFRLNDYHLICLDVRCHEQINNSSLYNLYLLKRYKHVFAFYTVSWYRDGTDIKNPSMWKTVVYLLHIQCHGCCRSGNRRSQSISRYGTDMISVRSQNYGCLVTWFCYQLIAKPGNKTATVPWPHRYALGIMSSMGKVIIAGL